MHGLPVEHEGSEAGLGLEALDQVIEGGNEARDEGRAREIPLPIPVGMGDEMVRPVRHANKLTVVLEGLGLLACAGGFLLEDVGEADGLVAPLDAALDQIQIGIVAEAEAVEALGFGSADVAGVGRLAG